MRPPLSTFLSAAAAPLSSLPNSRERWAFVDAARRSRPLAKEAAMTDSLWNKGDIVRLKCGGPAMVVEQVFANLENPYAHVVWFDDKGAPRMANFGVESLGPLPPWDP